MTASNIATLVDDAAVLNNEIKLLTAKLDAIKAQFKQAGVGEYDGHLAIKSLDSGNVQGIWKNFEQAISFTDGSTCFATR